MEKERQTTEEAGLPSKVILQLLIALVSIPAGATDAAWRSLGPFGGTFSTVALPTTTSGSIFSAAAGLWHVSDDRGRTWSLLPAPGGFEGAVGYADSLELDPRPGGGLYGRFSSGIVSPPVEIVWRLLDDRSAWIEIPCGFAQLLFPPAEPGVVYCWHPSRNDLVGPRSDDGGLTWSAPLPVPEAAFSGAPPDLQVVGDEIVIKVLDGCGINNRVWIFAIGLTDVGVELSVVDPLGGATWSHSSPPGLGFQPVLDVDALPCSEGP